MGDHRTEWATTIRHLRQAADEWEKWEASGETVASRMRLAADRMERELVRVIRGTVPPNWQRHGRNGDL